MSDGKEVRVIEDNNALKEKLALYKITKPEFFSFSTPEITLPDSSVVDLNAYKFTL